MTERSYTPRIFSEGNYCGHNPLQPKLVLAKPATRGKGGQPRVLTLLMERMQTFYYRPSAIPSLNLANESERQMRSERRESCLVVLAAILKNTNVATLRVGQPSKDGFISYGIRYLMQETFLSFSRVERAIGDLKAAGIIAVHHRWEVSKDGSYKGLPAVKTVNKHLFGAFGLTKMLEYERKKAAKREKRKAQQLGLDQKMTLSSYSRTALVFSGLKTSPSKRKPNKKLRANPPVEKKMTGQEISQSIDQRLARIQENIRNKA